MSVHIRSCGSFLRASVRKFGQVANRRRLEVETTVDTESNGSRISGGTPAHILRSIRDGDDRCHLANLALSQFLLKKQNCRG